MAAVKIQDLSSSLFGGNAFSSQVGQRIEKATDSNLVSEDWTLILEICDMINSTEEGPKDGIKAIRKRLSNQKNAKSLLYTLTVTEACVKNCGHRFHLLVANKDFLNDLTKLLGSKGQASSLPHAIQEKVLTLIQSWCDAFRNAADLQAIKKCYDDLKAQGHEFPAQNLDTLSPIFTPGRSELAGPPLPSQGPPMASQQQNAVRIRTFAPSTGRPQTAPARSTRQAFSGPINPSPEQLAKLRRELDIVEGNIRVESAMLTELQPGKEDPNDLKLMQELNKTCHQMQQRVVALVDKIANEEVTGVLLKINDDLNNLFIRFERYERNRKAVTGEATDISALKPVATPTTQSTLPPTQTSELIDFGLEVSSPVHQPTTAVAAADDEFDMFAQARSNTYADNMRDGSTYHDNTTGVPVDSIAEVMSAKGPYPKSEALEKSDGEVPDDIADVEEWLRGTDLSQLEAEEQEAREAVPVVHPPVQTQLPAANSMTSSEFDDFLNARAATGPQRANSQPRQPLPPRQLENFVSGEKTDEMFGL